MPTHLDSIFFTVAGPHLMLTRLSAPVSGVDCPCPCPVANSLSSFPNQLSSRVPLPLPATLRFQFQNPLSGFAPKQTKESSAWRATYIVLQVGLFTCQTLLSYLMLKPFFIFMSNYAFKLDIIVIHKQLQLQVTMHNTKKLGVSSWCNG